MLLCFLLLKKQPLALLKASSEDDSRGSTVRSCCCGPLLKDSKRCDSAPCVLGSAWFPTGTLLQLLKGFTCAAIWKLLQLFKGFTCTAIWKHSVLLFMCLDFVWLLSSGMLNVLHPDLIRRWAVIGYSFV